MKTKIMLSAIAVLILSLAGNALAQDGVQKITLEPQKGKGRRDKNIEKTNQTRRPPTGDTVCNIEIKNNTPDFIMIYINNILSGTIGGNSSYKVAENVGRIKVYRRTERQSNTFLYWGPNYFNCGTPQKDGAVLLEINPAKIL